MPSHQKCFCRVKTPGKTYNIIFQDGGFDRETGQLYNQLFTEAASAQSGIPLKELLDNRCFLSAEELCDIAREAGFEIERAQDLSTVFQGSLSPEAYASRFNMDETQLHNLQEVYRRWRGEGKLEFTDDPENPDNIRVKRSTIYLILKK